MCERVPEEVDIPLYPAVSHTDMKDHSVISFLRRPQLLSSFRWQSSALRSQNLFVPTGTGQNGLMIPSGLIRRPMLRNKLDGFTSFKATAVIRLQLNAQKFQCGRLLMAAAPMPQALGHRKDFAFYHVAQAQNLNHVQMDIAKDTEVTLRVPFISPYSCYDLISGKQNWGEIRILVYSPLSSVGSTCLQCVVYGHFEDIELGAPTSGEMAEAQSGKFPRSSRLAEATGKFTGAAATLGSELLRTTLDGVTPLVKAGASAMGWSKPILAKPSQVVLNRPTEGFAHMDGVDHSLVLAMTAGNAVDAIPNLVGTGIDETDFHRLKRIPQMISVFQYSDNIVVPDGNLPTCPGPNGIPVNQLLWQCAVSPSCNIPACNRIRVPEGDGVVNPYNLVWKQPTTLNYITAPFLQWTGSLVYTFKFVKTDYHSGRVEISFHPFVNNLDPRTVADRMDYVYRTVVDLRDNSEVSVTVPYISPQVWKRVSTFLDPVNPDPPAPGRQLDVITGMLAVRAITPLICANAIISPTIEVLVEMRAGDDFEVSIPTTSKFLPFSFGNPGNVNSPPVVDTAEAQSGAFGLRTPGTHGIMYARFDAPANSEGQTQVTFTGLRNFPMYGIELFIDWFSGTANNTTGVHRMQVEFVGKNVAPCFLAKGNWGGGSWHFVFQNDGADELVVRRHILLANPVGDNFYWQIDVNLYPIMSSETPISGLSLGEVTINPNQLPLPVASEGGGSVVRIDESQLPLQTVVTSQPVDVKINQFENNNLIRFDQPIDVNTEIVFPNSMDVVVTNTPLPVSGGGGSGGTVSIDPCQLPLWVSEFNVAPRDARQECPSAEAQAGKLATAGITETRTRAMEGWMPPSITGNEQDAHRPATTQYCIGERFTSFRQMSRRPAFCLVSGLDSSKHFTIQPMELIRPGILSMRVTPGALPGNDRTQYALYAPNTGAEVSGSSLNYVAGMFTFVRGSIRFKVWMDPRENPPNMISGHLEYTRQMVDTNIIDDNIENFMCPISYESPNQKQIAEFQVPYYSPTMVSTIWSHGVDSQIDVPMVNFVLSIPDFRQTTANFPIKVAVAAGDDMDFHQFIGPPPVINVGDLLNVGRQLHYPPTGFTPTQKVTRDTARQEEGATSFRRVLFEHFSWTGNPTGGSCPMDPVNNVFVHVDRDPVPISGPLQGTGKGKKKQKGFEHHYPGQTIPLARQTRSILSFNEDEGRDEVDGSASDGSNDSEESGYLPYPREGINYYDNVILPPYNPNY